MKIFYKTSHLRFKYLLTYIIVIFSGFTMPAQAQTLVWQEDFNSLNINAATWTYDFGNGSGRAAGYGWGNSELEYYTSRTENVRIENGSLVIEAKKENFDGSAFTSGRIKTEGRVHFKYGTVEARIKLPNMANGLWPAFWTLGTIGGSWPSIGEIDIMEAGSAAAIAANKTNKKISSATHWSNAGGAHEFSTSSLETAVDLSLDYHIYKLVWTSQAIKMFVDNVEVYSIDISTDPNLTEFHTPHFLLLNLAVGGAYTGIYEANGITAPLPGKMYVDYIKLYQNPGDELILGDNVAVTGNFGVLTETTGVSASLNFNINAVLNYWNNLTTITSPTPVPYEGSKLWAVHANSGNWFGMGVVNEYVNLKNFSSGFLKFQFKSSYAGQFKFGLMTGHGETWINFDAGVQKYGLIRDGNWHQVTIPMADFSNPSAGMNIDLQTLKSAFMFAGDPAATAGDFYFDDIYFQSVATATGSAPLTPAPIPPARIDSNVISLFSGAYTERSGTDWFPSWGQSTVVSDTSIEGNATKKYVNLNYQGVQFSPNINATGMEKLHIDLWTSNVTAFDVYIINEGPVEKKITITPTLSGWNSFDIDLNNTNFPGIDFSKVFQFKFVGAPDGGKIYLDNIYFWRAPYVAPESPMTPAPTPPARNSTDVISMFSGAYADVSGTEWFPNWGQSTVVSDTSIQGNATKKYVNLNYQGVNFNPNIDASAMQKLHIDVWTSNVTAIDLYIINPGPIEKKVTLTPTLRGWNSFDIDLNATNFPGIDFSKVYQFKIEGTPGGGKLYLDNIYFWKAPAAVVGIAPTVSITSPANNAQFTAPANITITADAADTDGSITKVEFFKGNASLGNVTAAPYSFEWLNAPAGDYALTARATDNDGNTISSAVVNISVKPAACTGTAVNGDYSYSVYTQAGIVYFTFHPLAPITGSNLAIINLKEGSGAFAGYGMTKSGNDFTFSKPISNGVATTFYFTYHTPPSGERNSMANPHTYTIGAVCITGAPTVSITTPANGASFIAPANIVINADAADTNGGTISKVEFYNGPTLLGMDETSPYSFNWNNVTAGPYSITARATDNDGLTSTSTAVTIAVNNPNPNGFCGTAVSGDYEYKAETKNGVVTFRLHPLAPIQGSLYAIINIAAPSPANVSMTRSGTDFVYSQPFADGAVISYSFTYHTPPGGENNSGANKHSYTVGSNCMSISGSTPTIQLTTPINNASYTEPATVSFNATAADADGTISNVKFYSGGNYLGMDETAPFSFDWTNAPAGNYNVSAWATDNNGYTTISNTVNIVVNINHSAGFCGTVANGDYNYKVETVGDKVTFTFHPLAPIAGSNLALIYIREGLTGGYPGYGMNAIGPDFRFTKTIAPGTPISFYFTYHTPPSGERNSSATPHSYTTGNNCIGTLPVSLVNYTAVLQSNGMVNIKWTTINEQNNDHFIVEKSQDGRTFKFLAKIAGANNSSVPANYTTLDANPVNGTNYYRLTQVDRDGKYKVYDIKTVMVKQQQSSITIYPQPLQNNNFTIRLASPITKKLQLRITTMQGKHVYSNYVNAQGGIIQVKLPAKPAPGIYMVSVEENEPAKIIVQ